MESGVTGDAEADFDAAGTMGAATRGADFTGVVVPGAAAEHAGRTRHCSTRIRRWTHRVATVSPIVHPLPLCFGRQSHRRGDQVVLDGVPAHSLHRRVERHFRHRNRLARDRAACRPREHVATPPTESQRDRSRGPHTRPTGPDVKSHQGRRQARRRLRTASARTAAAATPGPGTAIAVPSEPMLPNTSADTNPTCVPIVPTVLTTAE